MEPGKLFIGGISWDTNEDRLREYFQTFGEVVEAVIMKDRATGRARGFGFVIYADPVVAELVVRQKHMIDGRTVEAKKAVPRDDQQFLNRNHSSPSASPVPVRTKKIFVGGLASTVTEGDFKRYFDQFGTIIDVVVMYDHNTQRPRGFGFITFDSEEAVEKALVRNFHELNGKMVEVKRAVPKELSPGPSRNPLGVCSSGFSRVNNILNSYGQRYSQSPIGGNGVKIDERQNLMSFARSGFPSFNPSSYGSALSYEPRVSPSFGEPANLFPKLSYEQGLNPAAFHSSNINRHDSFAEYDGVNRGSSSTLGSSSWSLWGNGGVNDTTYSENSAAVNFRLGDINSDAHKSSEAIWNSSPISAQNGGHASVFSGLNLSYGHEDVNIESPLGLYDRDFRTRAPHSLDGGFEAKFDNLIRGDQSLLLPSLGLGNGVSDVPLNNPAGLCW